MNTVTMLPDGFLVEMVLKWCAHFQGNMDIEHPSLGSPVGLEDKKCNGPVA